MKKIIFTALTLISFGVFAQGEKEIDSEIKAVTVYLNGAEINRTFSTSIASGINDLKLTNLSPFIEPNSIQVTANNKNVTIVSVNHEINYLDRNELNKSPSVLKINDSIKELEFKLEIRQSYERVYTEEKSLLLTNKNIGGANTGVDIEDLMDAADFYRERLSNIETKLLDIRRSKQEIRESINRLNRQRNSYFNNVKNTGEIIVNLTSSARTNARIEVSYIVNNAGWVPFYDIRSKNLDEPIDFTYKGKVFQKTGNDWDNVKVKLSTGNPSVNNTQPTFSRWYLQSYDNTQNYPRKSKKRSKVSYAYKTVSDFDLNAVSEESEAPVMPGRSYDKEESKSTADYTTVTQSTVNTTFDIALPYSIKSNGKPNLIEIQNYELPVSYQYFSLPKQDDDAFLLANIIGWGDYSLLSGDANIYFENTFVGESYIDTEVTDDTLKVSMGRDKSIIIKREKIKDFCKTKTLGGNKKTTRGYELTVRNNKAQTIEIELVEQIPLTKRKDIEVSLLESSNAKYDETTGKLTWNISIAGNSSKTVNYKFEIKHPKNRTISNL